MFITSGIISAKKEDVKKALTGAGFVIQEVTLMEDWVAIIAQKQA